MPDPNTIDELPPYDYPSQKAEDSGDAPECAFVKKWLAKIKAAKTKWEPDFKRIRENIDFATGFQWEGQKNLNEDRYIANITLRFVNQKVSTLYARDPKAESRRRDRLDFTIWDGKMESLQQAMMLMGDPSADIAGKMLAQATIQDYLNGQQQHVLLDKICKSLDILYKWNIDNQQPTFKLQMKQLVRRVVTTGVGYVKLGYVSEGEGTLDQTDTESTISERLKRIKLIVDKHQDGDIQDDSSEMETLKSLAMSIGASIDSGDPTNVNEHLVFTFPAATSIIVDPKCRALKGFVGAQWVAEEMYLPLDYVREFFEKPDIQASTISDTYMSTMDQDIPKPEQPENADGEATKPSHGYLYHVYDLRTKSQFFVLNGYEYFVQEPQAVEPETNHFWPFFAITFNDVECEPGVKSTIYPPSDVQLVKSAQREWNKSRQSLREQRRANSPKYLTAKGVLTENDKSNLISAAPNCAIELEGITPGTDPNTVLRPWQPAPIDPAAYDTQPLVQDMFFVQQTEDGPTPSSSKATATAATINEQARVTNASSNVDDLDDLLSELAQAGGEILLRSASVNTVKRVAGPGAAWPETDREDYVNAVLLEHVAASSGRPNRALELSNWAQVGPMLQAAGANPQFIIRETLKRLDDRLKPEDAFSTLPQPTGVAPVSQPQPIAPTAQGQYPPQHTMQNNQTP